MSAGKEGSIRAILYALGANFGIAVSKFGAAWWTNSGSMLAEAIHSTADCVNQLLARAVRASDVVGRLGGDEFACLLADLPGREQLCHLACKLFDAVSAPVKVGTLRLTVRPSIGIAVCPTDGASTDELLKSADAAMYAAKRDRSGYAFFACGSRA